MLFPGLLSHVASARAGGCELLASSEGPAAMAHPFSCWAPISILPAPPCPAPSLVKVLTPSGRLRFCKNKDKHKVQAEAKATTVREQALG